MSISQLPAEIDVRDDGVVLEVIANIAVRPREIRQSRAPSVRVGLLVRDVPRDPALAELPHPDSLVPPLDRHDAAALLVPRLAVAVVVSLDAAAGIVVLLVEAVLLLHVALLLAAHVHLAPLRRVQRHLVAVVGLVDGLHDVDLAVLGPVIGIGEPQSGPRTATEGGVLDVKYEKTRVVGRT